MTPSPMARPAPLALRAAARGLRERRGAALDRQQRLQGRDHGEGLRVHHQEWHRLRGRLQLHRQGENDAQGGPELGLTAAFSSRTPAGMCGPACILRADLTPFAQGRPLLGRRGAARGRHGQQLHRRQGRVISDCHLAAQLNLFIPGLLHIQSLFFLTWQSDVTRRQGQR